MQIANVDFTLHNITAIAVKVVPVILKKILKIIRILFNLCPFHRLLQGYLFAIQSDTYRNEFKHFEAFSVIFWKYSVELIVQVFTWISARIFLEGAEFRQPEWELRGWLSSALRSALNSAG